MKTLLFLLISTISVTAWAQAPELVIPVGHKAINTMDVSADRSLAATAANVVKVWEYQTGRLLKTFTHPKLGTPTCVKFLPDNKTLVITGEGSRGGNSLLLLDTATWQTSQVIEGDFGAYAMQISTDGRTAYTGAYKGGKVNRIDLVTGVVTTLYEMAGASATRNLSLAPDGKRLLALFSKGSFWGDPPYASVLLSATTGGVEKLFPENTQYQRFTPLGNLLSIGRQGGTMSPLTLTWSDGKTFQVIGQQEIPVPYSPHHMLDKYDFFPASDRLFFSGGDKQWTAAPMQSATELSFVDPRNKFRSISLKINRLCLVGENELLVNTENYFLYKLNTNSNQLVEDFGLAVFTPVKIYAAQKGKALAVEGYKTQPYLLSWNDGHPNVRQLHNINTRYSFKEYCVTVSPDGSLVAFGSRSEITIAATRTPTKPLARYAIPNGNHLAISPDNNLIVVGDTSQNIFVINRSTKSVTPMGQGEFSEGVISEDNRYFIGLQEASNGDTLMGYFDLTLGKKLWSIADRNHRPGRNPFILDANEVGFIDFRNRTVVFLKSSDGSLSRAPSYSAALFDGNPKLKGKFLYEELNRTQPDNVYDVGLVENGAFYLRAQDDYTLKIFQSALGRQVGEIILTENTDEWAVIAPDGRFDASAGMMKALYYRRGKTTIALEALSEKFYTPNLLAQLFAEAPAPTPEPKKDDIKHLKLPPLTRIAPPVDIEARNLVVENDTPTIRRFGSQTGRIKLTVEATSSEDAVSEIRLFHNGKLIGTGTRNLIVEDDKIEKRKIVTYELQLVEGENHLRAVALNTQRTESRPDEIIVSHKSVATAAATTNTSTLHLLVVGINQYKNPKYNLNYATADAMAFRTALESISIGLFGKINAVYIGDAQATKAGLSAEFEKIRANAQLQDVFIFYYAGHGVLNEKKEFHLVPHDVTQLYGADEALAQRGFSATLMQQYSREIKAQKQLFILDACQSAGALNNVVATRGVAEEKAISQLARATGTHWLTASGSEQFAAEFKQIGHGTFTYVLLEALSGKADKGADRKITVKELDAYLQEIVPEITARYRGAAQYPASYGFGHDFPIGVVK